MLGAARPDDDTRDAPVGEDPCKRQRRHVDPALARGLCEPFEPVVHRVVVEMPVRLRTQRHSRSRGRRLAASVLPGQPAALERAEDDERDAPLRTERKNLPLGFPIQQREGVLHDRHRRNGQRLLRPGPVDVAGPDRADTAGVEELGEGLDGLRDRRVWIRLVDHVRVHPLDPEPVEAPLDLPQDPVAVETAVGRIADDRMEDLRRERRPIPSVGHPPPDPGLAPPAAVRVGRIEPGEPQLPGSVHQGERLFFRLTLPEEGACRADPAEVSASEDEAVQRFSEYDSSSSGCWPSSAPLEPASAAGSPSGVVSAGGPESCVSASASGDSPPAFATCLSSAVSTSCTCWFTIGWSTRWPMLPTGPAMRTSASQRIVVPSPSSSRLNDVCMFIIAPTPFPFARSCEYSGGRSSVFVKSMLIFRPPSPSGILT